MNFLKGYVGTISDFVSGVIGEPEEENNKNEPSPVEVESITKNSETGEIDEHNTIPASTEQNTGSSSLLDWIPKLQRPTGENAVVYYMNRLASFGGDHAVDASETVPDSDVSSTVITSDVPSLETLAPTSDVSTSDKQNESTGGADGSQLEDALLDWLNGLSSRTGEVWSQMKQDFGEVVSVVSKEPRDSLTRTASSVRQRLAAMAEAALKIDPSEFALLPETAEPSVENDSSLAHPDVLSNPNLAPEDKIASPPKLSDLPSFSSIRSDVSHLFTGFVSSLFGSDDAQKTVVKDRREARLQIIRADPATYECEPAPPPSHLGVHSYADWRSAYFDETTCQPRPGIPLCAAGDIANQTEATDSLLEPPHPSPEELLDQYPFIRTYLTQLVQVEGQSGGKGLTDADFWSRYYYRVWLLDVTERHRQRLAERVALATASKTTDGGSPFDSTKVTGQTGKLAAGDGNDWLADSDAEDNTGSTTLSIQERDSPNDAKPLSQAVQPPLTPASEDTDPMPPTSVSDNSTSAPPIKTNKPRRKRMKKRSGSNIHEVEPQCSDSGSPIPHMTVKEPIPVHKSGASAPKSPNTAPDVPSPAVPIVPSELDSGARQVAESDDLITSGSSSVVVLSNSEEETEIHPMHPSNRTRPKTDAIDALISNTSDMDLGDWDDTSDKETKESDKTGSGKRAPKMPITPTDLDETENDDTDDWENWR